MNVKKYATMVLLDMPYGPCKSPHLEKYLMEQVLKTSSPSTKFMVGSCG